MEDTKVLSFNQLCESGFPYREYKWLDEQGHFVGIVEEKSWGRSQNLIVYCRLIENDDITRKICFSVYQQRDCYMGFKDVPKGAMLNLFFLKNSKNRGYLVRWNDAA